jgi:hypothetical protein
MDRIALSAKRVAAALGSRGAAVTDLDEATARCAARPGIDTIAVRRRVADAVIRAGRYNL